MTSFKLFQSQDIGAKLEEEDVYDDSDTSDDEEFLSSYWLPSSQSVLSESSQVSNVQNSQSQSSYEPSSESTKDSEDLEDSISDGITIV